MAADTKLIWTIAATQVMGWGTLFTPFALMMGPMEEELGWSRSAISLALTIGLLASGLAAVPVGRWVDRHGGRGPIAWGGLAGAVLLLAWSQVQSLPALYAVWLLMGVVHAAALWGPAMAVMVATARDPMRAITGLTFITGFTATVFLPLGAWMIEALGWRGALLAMAALQVVPVPLALWGLRGAGVRAKLAAPAVPLGPMLRRPEFVGLAVWLAAYSFIGVGVGSHLVQLLRERGLAEAWVLVLVAMHGPFQVAARAVLYMLGARVRVLRVGMFAAALVPLAMVWLWLAQANPWWLMGFMLAWAVSDGLLTIVRAAAPAELLGRDGYGAITGSLSALAVVPRAAAPAALALVWQWGGGYGAVPAVLVAVGVVALVGFLVAVRAHSSGHEK